MYFQTPVFGMRVSDWIQVVLFIIIIAICVVPLGGWMAKVYTGKPNFMTPVTDVVEQKFLALGGVDGTEEMDWKEFAIALMVFTVPCILVVFLLQLFQQFLPLNPAGLGPVPWDLSLNTAVSFATNTNWQAYVPEVTVSYFTQMVGLAVQNFMSAAKGMAVLIALILAFSRRSGTTIGNFWVLLIRSVMILLPICLAIALVLVWQGVPQTFSGPVTVPLLNPVNDSNGNPVTTQTIPLGPVASQIAIKQLGTNGGGFYNANSAHPLENPTPFSNFLETLAILFIPTALCYTFGKMIGSGRKGIALLMAMCIIFLPLAGIAIYSELGGNPAYTPLGIDQNPGHAQPGGNMEGKEVRFGIVPSAFFSVVTTVTSCGAVDSMHDSYMPLGGLVQMFDIQLGEVVYGGVGPDSTACSSLPSSRCSSPPDGRPDSGTLWQKNRTERDETCDHHYPDPDLPYPHLHSHCSDNDRGPGRAVQPGTARVLRDPVRVLVRIPEQWQRLCRAQREQPLLYPDDSVCHVCRAVSGDHPYPRPCRFARCEEDRPGQRGHPAGSPAPLYHLAGLCHPHHRWPEFLPALSLGPVAEYMSMVAGGMIHV